ncbi:hypothetical protein LEP1GSC038_1077 [Leptospira weilii str. 2006001855]|uniref:Uncharacterized protein n=1 Tax=Leptospira weilii str. 2006001855 TaxID=996804 RepID=M6FHH3_9LEPT|nr:hypothetical protein LEP1GSC038_1077 [Leptospira weilii str. 2006001855]OMI18372.1 hypothetical protein BUQ74_05645 [Leptospira weilii serovar Heyan]
MGTPTKFGETGSGENTQEFPEEGARRDFSKGETSLFASISFIKILIAKVIRTKRYKPFYRQFRKE